METNHFNAVPDAKIQKGIQIFKSPQFGEIRTAGTSEQPLFCLPDLCRAVGITNSRNVRNRLDDDDVHLMDTVDSIGKKQEINFVTESGMYDVILRSDSPQAKPFRKWVTSEILPQIRRTGGYIPLSQEDDEKTILAKAVLILNRTVEEQKNKVEQAEKKALLLQSQNEAQADWIGRQDEMLESRSKHIRQMIPSVTFANAVKTSERSILIGELARIIKQNGVEIGQNRLFAWMRERGYLIKSTEAYNQPTQKAMNMGLFEIKKTVITKPNGTNLVTTTSKVTGKGQIYFVNKFLYEDANRQGAEFQKKLEAERKKGGAL